MATNLNTQADAGSNAAHPSWEEAMSAATREAAAEFSSMTGEGTEVPEDADPDADEASEGETEGDDTAPETEETATDEDSSGETEGAAEPLGMKWDGNPDTIPAEIDFPIPSG